MAASTSGAWVISQPFFPSVMRTTAPGCSRRLAGAFGLSQAFTKASPGPEMSKLTSRPRDTVTFCGLADSTTADSSLPTSPAWATASSMRSSRSVSSFVFRSTADSGPR